MTLAPSPAARIQERKRRLAGIRARAAELLADGAFGMQIASLLSDLSDQFAVSIFTDTLQDLPEADREQITRNSALVAVGGSGRGEVAPFSDADLLFVYRPQVATVFSRFSQRLVAEYWDAGVKLGQRVFTVQDAIRQALADPHLASSMVFSRCLWGDETLSEQLKHRFSRRVVRHRRSQFILDCIQGRLEERDKSGATAQQLEPDVKQSLGGLRDVHLLQWIAYACYETADIDALRRKDVLTREDATRLLRATEFLTRVRIDMHLHAGKASDLLTREEQLRIAQSLNLPEVEGLRPVEQFMQDYFSHSMAIEEITRRFIERHRPRAVADRLKRAVIAHRVNGHFVLRVDELDVQTSYLSRVCTTLEDILRIYHAAALYRVRLSPRLTETIKQTARNLPSGPSTEASRLFMELLGTIGSVASTLRSMHDTNVLELVIPEWHRVRCLLQFNQYHHFTVDEHTLRCLEICESFYDQDTPIGAAYSNVKSRQLLHLALLLHDAGKGFVEDHSEVGRRIAETVCQRMKLSRSQTDTVSFLVHKHLKMADIAFRKNISDPRVVLEFSHEVGSAEKLRMLYVLTAADVSGVGPDVWNSWKEELLADFYQRVLLNLSGQPPHFHEEQRLRQIREHVYRSIAPLQGSGEEPHEQDPDLPDPRRRWIDQQLDAFSSQYLTQTAPPRIAADLDIIRGLEPGEIHVEGAYDKVSGQCDYRIIADPSHSTGCFHLITGALTAQHLEVLGAEITTSQDDVIVDVFHVIDGDFADAVPEWRLSEVAASIRQVLDGTVTVEKLFQKHRRYSSSRSREPVMELPTRVEIDNNSSDLCNIISVFAHDRPGLLYTIARTLSQLGLSIEIARISTHFDQVVDVFHVTDLDGARIESETQLQSIKERMKSELENFEASAHRQFVS